MIWPVEQAKRLLPRTTPVLFETGYGPSGLPHIGTFAEVARTTWVRQAFTELIGLPSRLIAFSDDMDALRKTPENMPNKEMLDAHHGFSLSNIPNPFDTDHTSFSAHNNAKLCEFLDSFGFDYEFASATDYYSSGRFNEAITRVLECHDEIVDVMVPTLGKERASNYSPLLPLHPMNNKVMQVEIKSVHPKEGMIVWHWDGQWFETSALNGNCKLQWKADWAMRWYALGVDYEMSGKDLIDSVKLSSKICRILGKEPPLNFTYELFLDEDGKKTSKSKGNGTSIEEWLRYGTTQSLSQFMFGNPTQAKRIYFEVISRATDEYIQNKNSLVSQSPDERRNNPAWYVDNGIVSTEELPNITYNMLMNLVGVANSDDPTVIWSYLEGYLPGVVETPFLTNMVLNAINLYKDKIEPNKEYRAPTEHEQNVLSLFIERLDALPRDATAEVIQADVFAVGKEHFTKLKEWFDCLYQVLLGQKEGPRFGMFIALYGIDNTIDLIKIKISSV